MLLKLININEFKKINTWKSELYKKSYENNERRCDDDDDDDAAAQTAQECRDLRIRADLVLCDRREEALGSTIGLRERRHIKKN